MASRRKKAAQAFPLRATQSYVSKIQPNNPMDPLLLQVLPLHEETLDVEGYSTDPLEENKANVAPGLIHKYHGRVLFIAAPQCAINCRYCFRRHFDYSSNTPSRKDWQKALEYIRQDSSIEEIIFSGGDPLVLPDKQLQWLLNELSEIKHLSRLRFHSRLPIVLPERITPELLNMLAETPLSSTFVIHCNHPQELDQNVAKALSDLKRSSVLLNQSVLLKNINDNADTLTKLSKDLFHLGALPYYLHLLDKVEGTAHFDVSLETAKKLNQAIVGTFTRLFSPQTRERMPEHQTQSAH